MEGRGANPLQSKMKLGIAGRTALEQKIAALSVRLYDSRTPERTRRVLSQRVSDLRWKLGAPTVDQMLAGV